ncbi:MAG: endolytic transglycosylase MltG [Candidatus Kaiserbacteria bacterium]|nr:endolytic transglycosylase MltG [Candidatus Kaiserbacteria bacterium]
MVFLKRNILLIGAFVLAIIFFGGYCLFISPPANFPSGSIIVIAEGTSAPQVAEEFARAHVIASPTLLQLVLRVSGKSNHIQTGAYRFQSPENLFSVAYRIATGEYGIPLVRITFIEGTTMREEAEQVAEAFSTISVSDFLKASESYEGYLFPDTYVFLPIADAESIVEMMRANFNTKIASLSEEIKASGHSLSDIVVMASLIEKEARTDADRHTVAGILWNRFAIGMPLQVDAAPDTYKHVGLPLEPICNPGLESIDAALRPTKTNYMYYLTGKDDLMHYATTFAGHQSNVKKYLQ